LRADDSQALKAAVFVMTNAADHNQVLSYARHSDGTLQLIDRTLTGGRGSGGTIDPLGSQGSLTLSQDHRFLFAVNAGDGTVSSFQVGRYLQLMDVEPTLGSAPVAVAQCGRLVYVLNFAGNSNVTGFALSDDGRLHPIPGSVSYLSSANSGASSLAFSPDGKFLVVTEKLTNNIDVFPVSSSGALGTPVLYKDPNAGLFDVIFTPAGTLIALEAGAATISSFTLSSSGAVTPLTTGVATLGAASCWLAATGDGQYIYTSNAGSANISGYSDNLSPIAGTIVGTNPTGSTNVDLAIDGSSQFVYTLDAGTGSVSAFAIQHGGVLQLIGIVGGLTPSSGLNGIAAL
jgi:6-phosphogluconolactonase (cycloisomerase 2 family)